VEYKDCPDPAELPEVWDSQDSLVNRETLVIRDNQEIPASRVNRDNQVGSLCL